MESGIRYRVACCLACRASFDALPTTSAQRLLSTKRGGAVLGPGQPRRQGPLHEEARTVVQSRDAIWDGAR